MSQTITGATRLFYAFGKLPTNSTALGSNAIGVYTGSTWVATIYKSGFKYFAETRSGTVEFTGREACVLFLQREYGLAMRPAPVRNNATPEGDTYEGSHSHFFPEENQRMPCWDPSCA